MTKSVKCEIASSHALLEKTKNRLCEEHGDEAVSLDFIKIDFFNNLKGFRPFFML